MWTRGGLDSGGLPTESAAGGFYCLSHAPAPPRLTQAPPPSSGSAVTSAAPMSAPSSAQFNLTGTQVAAAARGSARPASLHRLALTSCIRPRTGTELGRLADTG